MRLFPYHTLLALLTLPIIANPPGTTNSPPSPARQRKAGMGWPNGNRIDITQYHADKVSWYYTWTPVRVRSYNLEFVPMIWGREGLPQIVSAIEKSIKRGKVHVVLGMNEPEIEHRANITPRDAASLWQNHISPLKMRNTKIRLGSPASSGSREGKEWLHQFFDLCTGCIVDFIAIHWYGTNATLFITHLTDYHDTFNLPIWVTEWACHNFTESAVQCSPDEISRFLNETQAFMDKTEWVERYAWFGAMRDLGDVNQDNALMSAKGKINELGTQYIGRSLNAGVSFKPRYFLNVVILFVIFTMLL